jgi:predicted nucleic acid-binding protein
MAVWDACLDVKNSFINQTARTTKVGLELAVRHDLGGRDALILATLLTARVREFRTFDKSLIALKRISFGKSSLAIKPA